MECLSLKDFFANFSNQAKLDIILLLARGPANVTKIVEKTEQEQSAVSHNLRKLCDCNVLEVKREGRERIYSLNKNTVTPMLKLVGNHVRMHCKGECCKR